MKVRGLHEELNLEIKLDTTDLPLESRTYSSDDPLSSSTIVGIVLSLVVLVVCTVLVFAYLAHKRRHSAKYESKRV